MRATVPRCAYSKSFSCLQSFHSVSLFSLSASNSPAHPRALHTVFLAQPDKFDKEQSENWKGDTEGFPVIVCRRTILFLLPLTCS